MSLNTVIRLLAVAALLGVAWLVCGPGSALELTLATVTVVAVSAIWTIWRARKRVGKGADSPSDDKRIDPQV